MVSFKYAYVRYLEDNLRKTVKIEDIRRFDHATHQPSKIYLIRWTPGPSASTQDPEVENASDSDIEMEHPVQGEYYKGQILMLAGSKEEIDIKMSSGSRFRIPKVLDSSVESSTMESEDEAPLAVVESKKKCLQAAKERKEKLSSVKKASKSAFTEIFETKLKRKKMTPCVAADDDDQGDMIKRLQQENATLRADLQASKLEQAALRKLNFRLQKEILERFSDVPTPWTTIPPNAQPPKTQQLQPPKQQPQPAKRQPQPPKQQPQPAKRQPQPPKQLQPRQQPQQQAPRQQLQPQQQAPQQQLQPQQPAPQQLLLPQAVPAHEGRPLYKAQDGQVSLGEGIVIPQTTYEAICGQRKYSLFVKGLAVAIWGSETLRQRSVDGKACPRYAKSPDREVKRALSPKKLKAAEDCFVHHLGSSPLTAEERRKEETKFKGYIREKMQDLNRAARKL